MSVTSYLRNAIGVVGLVAGSLLYFVLAAKYVPPEYALLVNFGIIPVVVGVCGYMVFRGPVYLRALLVSAVPVALVLYFGADPGKPGIEMTLFYVYLGTVLAGLGIGFIIEKVLRRNHSSPN
jgi:hypothetical protein